MWETINLLRLEQADTVLFAARLRLQHITAWYREPEDWIYEVEHQTEEYPWLHHLLQNGMEKRLVSADIMNFATAGKSGTALFRWKRHSALTI
ncbi:MAG: hypothetical protein VB062_06935 [Christensenella sp.]|nr:hypothetical protein [Christensenella sp.]